MFIDNRFEENNDTVYNDEEPHSEYDEIDREIDEEEERKRKEEEDLKTYEEQVRESDEINYKIQAEMEQYMFENGKDYENYQEPQLYDTEDDLVDSLNNDLDDCLSKE